MVFMTSGVSANLRLEIENPFCCCSVQKLNTAATSIIKIQYLLNRLADRFIWVMVRKLVELTKFLVFNSWTNSFGNCSDFAFYLLLFAFIQISVFAFSAFDMGLVTYLSLHFSWSWIITPTSTSMRMGDCIPWASIARGFQECYTMHSSVLASTGMLRSTIADCPRPMAWTSARLAWWYCHTPFRERGNEASIRVPRMFKSHAWQ
jgi:hypothetical protein